MKSVRFVGVVAVAATLFSATSFARSHHSERSDNAGSYAKVWYTDLERGVSLDQCGGKVFLVRKAFSAKLVFSGINQCSNFKVEYQNRLVGEDNFKAHGGTDGGDYSLPLSSELSYFLASPELLTITVSSNSGAHKDVIDVNFYEDFGTIDNDYHTYTLSDLSRRVYFDNCGGSVYVTSNPVVLHFEDIRNCSKVKVLASNQVLLDSNKVALKHNYDGTMYGDVIVSDSLMPSRRTVLTIQLKSNSGSTHDEFNVKVKRDW